MSGARVRRRVDEEARAEQPWTLEDYEWDPVLCMARKKRILASGEEPVATNVAFTALQHAFPVETAERPTSHLALPDNPQFQTLPILETVDRTDADPATVCEVVGCGVSLEGLKRYYVRMRVCEKHLHAPAIVVNGVVSRFCQQCAKFQFVGDFSGNKKSCISTLERHNARHRAKVLARMQDLNDGDSDCGTGGRARSSKGGKGAAASKRKAGGRGAATGAAGGGGGGAVSAAPQTSQRSNSDNSGASTMDASWHPAAGAATRHPAMAAAIGPLGDFGGPIARQALGPDQPPAALAAPNVLSTATGGFVALTEATVTATGPTPSKPASPHPPSGAWDGASSSLLDLPPRPLVTTGGNGVVSTGLSPTERGSSGQQQPQQQQLLAAEGPAAVGGPVGMQATTASTWHPQQQQPLLPYDVQSALAAAQGQTLGTPPLQSGGLGYGIVGYGVRHVVPAAWQRPAGAGAGVPMSGLDAPTAAQYGRAPSASAGSDASAAKVSQGTARQALQVADSAEGVQPAGVGGAVGAAGVGGFCSGHDGLTTAAATKSGGSRQSDLEPCGSSGRVAMQAGSPVCSADEGVSATRVSASGAGSMFDGAGTASGAPAAGEMAARINSIMQELCPLIEQFKQEVAHGSVGFQHHESAFAAAAQAGGRGTATEVDAMAAAPPMAGCLPAAPLAPESSLAPAYSFPRDRMGLNALPPVLDSAVAMMQQASQLAATLKTQPPRGSSAPLPWTVTSGSPEARIALGPQGSATAEALRPLGSGPLSGGSGTSSNANAYMHGPSLPPSLLAPPPPQMQRPAVAAPPLPPPPPGWRPLASHPGIVVNTAAVQQAPSFMGSGSMAAAGTAPPFPTSSVTGAGASWPHAPGPVPSLASAGPLPPSSSSASTATTMHTPQGLGGGVAGISGGYAGGEGGRQGHLAAGYGVMPPQLQQPSPQHQPPVHVYVPGSAGSGTGNSLVGAPTAAAAAAAHQGLMQGATHGTAVRDDESDDEMFRQLLTYLQEEGSDSALASHTRQQQQQQALYQGIAVTALHAVEYHQQTVQTMPYGHVPSSPFYWPPSAPQAAQQAHAYPPQAAYHAPAPAPPVWPAAPPLSAPPALPHSEEGDDVDPRELTRVSLKAMNMLPDELPPNLRTHLRKWLKEARAEALQATLRPGCLQLVVDVLRQPSPQQLSALLIPDDDGYQAAADVFRVLGQRLRDTYVQVDRKVLQMRVSERPVVLSWEEAAYEGGLDGAEYPTFKACSTAAVCAGTQAVLQISGEHLVQQHVKVYARLCGRDLQTSLMPPPQQSGAAAAGGGAVDVNSLRLTVTVPSSSVGLMAVEVGVGHLLGDWWPVLVLPPGCEGAAEELRRLQEQAQEGGASARAVKRLVTDMAAVMEVLSNVAEAAAASAAAAAAAATAAARLSSGGATAAAADGNDASSTGSRSPPEGRCASPNNGASHVSRSDASLTAASVSGWSCGGRTDTLISTNVGSTLGSFMTCSSAGQPHGPALAAPHPQHPGAVTASAAAGAGAPAVGAGGAPSVPAAPVVPAAAPPPTATVRQALIRSARLLRFAVAKGMPNLTALLLAAANCLSGALEPRQGPGGDQGAPRVSSSRAQVLAAVGVEPQALLPLAVLSGSAETVDRLAAFATRVLGCPLKLDVPEGPGGLSALHLAALLPDGGALACHLLATQPWVAWEWLTLGWTAPEALMDAVQGAAGDRLPPPSQQQHPGFSNGNGAAATSVGDGVNGVVKKPTDGSGPGDEVVDEEDEEAEEGSVQPQVLPLRPPRMTPGLLSEMLGNKVTVHKAVSILTAQRGAAAAAAGGGASVAAASLVSALEAWSRTGMVLLEALCAQLAQQQL